MYSTATTMKGSFKTLKQFKTTRDQTQFMQAKAVKAAKRTRLASKSKWQPINSDRVQALTQFLKAIT